MKKTREVPVETPVKMPSKLGVVLLNMGGPPNQTSVVPFLYNMFSDPDLIRLPFSFLFQKPLAWWIAQTRGPEARKNYAKMGGEGGSPQLAIASEQAQALETALAATGLDCQVYVAMRYWEPFTDKVVETLLADGVTHLVAVSLYPHFSYTTTGSSLKALRQALNKTGHKLPWSVVSGYCKQPAYLASLAACIQAGLDNHQWSCPKEAVQILFSAHSLPQRHVRQTGDPYPQLILQCAQRVMADYFPRHEWDLAYQSKVGKMPWLGPATDGVMHYYAGLEMDNILVVPISFVSDHVETLVEIDQDYGQLATYLGLKHFHRAPVMNTHPQFIAMLVQEILKKSVVRCLTQSRVYEPV